MKMKDNLVGSGRGQMRSGKLIPEWIGWLDWLDKNNPRKSDNWDVDLWIRGVNSRGQKNLVSWTEATSFTRMSAIALRFSTARPTTAPE